jgi:UDP-N-acetylglucosamine--N-acetylmuramyl-(pentapeptide) pyrophosphoryl-undecaprenol N-acetylglucosamine transferase
VNSESTIGTAERPLRIVIAGGGTGGHVSPGVAVLEELRSRMTISPLWIGSKRGFEFDTAGRLDIPFRAIQVGKLRRYPSFQTLIDATRIPIGIAQAWRHLRTFRPDVVFATGGYVSTPVVVAASRLHIPSMTHEQTAHIGLATKLNARFVDTIALSYERSRVALGPTNAAVVVTGNPVRSAIHNGCAESALERFGFSTNLPLIYVTGGALGARAINNAVADALPELLPHVQILHQCGPRSSHDDIDTLNAIGGRLPADFRSRYHVVERVSDEIADIFAAAALVVGRAGAGTIAELAAAQLPSILIPLPGAEEQRQNALYLADAGAAVMLAQYDLTPARLASLVKDLISTPERLATMRLAAGSAATPDASRCLVDELLSLIPTR